MAAIGESIAGIGHSCNNFAYIYISKGLGGGVIVDGKLLRGKWGNAGEFAGVLTLEENENRPSLELLRQLVSKHDVAIADISDLIVKYDSDWTGVDIWMEKVKFHMERIISSISGVLDPEAIVIGGRMPEPLAKRIIEEIKFFNVPRRKLGRPLPQIVGSQVRGDATAIGAAATPLKEIFLV